MKHVTLTQLRAKYRELIAQVSTTGEPITVPKRGRPLVQIVPVAGGVLETEAAPNLFGRLRGSVIYEGNIVSPTGEVWGE